VVRAAQVVIPDQELACFEAEDPQQMRWLPTPGPGNATVVSVFIAEPPDACNWSGPEQGGQMLGIMACPTRFTWVVHTTQRFDDGALKLAEDGREKALSQLPGIDSIPPDAPGLRMFLCGNSGTPADVFFIELNASTEPAGPGDDRALPETHP
jgi:hypothetical protein